MIEKRRPFLHRVLVITEGFDALLDKILKGRQRIRPRNAPTKGFKITIMIRKPLFNENHHLARNRIG